jgi:single-strand DNA-binding protein
MASLNKVLLMGNLTRDPELKHAASGIAIATFGLAVNSKLGKDKDEVCFIDVTAFGRQAETASEYLAKGSPALIEGRLTFESWEGQDGQKRSKHKVIAERIQFMARKGESPSTAVVQSPAGSEDNDDDIPF